MSFIKLIEHNGNLIILNTDRIDHITIGTRGEDTYIKMIGTNNGTSLKENYFFVKETIESIWNMLHPELYNMRELKND